MIAPASLQEREAECTDPPAPPAAGGQRQLMQTAPIGNSDWPEGIRVAGLVVAAASCRRRARKVRGPRRGYKSLLQGEWKRVVGEGSVASRFALPSSLPGNDFPSNERLGLSGGAKRTKEATISLKVNVLTASMAAKLPFLG